ncbi:fibulin-1-like [Eucyclogobius newberryi]|uniref:fibulin-1-like n=1 Tax=Eucyclogobius newberryi TaxID=166745 RepID=UPI003B599942
MARWAVLLCCFYVVVARGRERRATVHQCCEDGRDRGLKGHDCAVLPLMSSDHTCMVVQEQCCAAAVERRLCDVGVETARRRGACERPFLQGDLLEPHVSKVCCGCCVLGHTVARQGSGCDLERLLLGKLCEHTARACCNHGNATTETTEAPAEGLEKNLEKDKSGTNVTATPKEDAHLCKGIKHEPKTLCIICNNDCLCSDSRCSQLCLGIGSCGCRDGYRLKEDGVSCEDVNECLSGDHNCVFGLFCVNTEGSFRCQRETGCGTGYELTDSNRCQDIDECVLGSHNCGPEFVCSNTAGSFRCHPKDSCPSGYIQDAIGSCIDINECVVYGSPCPPGQSCINSPGSFTCRRNTVTCGRGYHLTEDGARCVDVDECRAGGVCRGHACINLIGSYRCECRVGYTFNSITKLCDDLNECRHYPGTLCAHKCENTDGSYACSCTSGFKLASDGRNCEDLNECETNPCGQECANVYGSYQCYCRRGYQLSDIDGVSCEDIDECALPTGGHVCSYRCANAPGSFYCTCPTAGYTLAPNGRSCQDIDECATGSHTCSATQSCFNVQGGYRCLSFECPENFRKAAPGRCERVTCEFTRSPASCLSLPLGISYYNLTFPADTPAPADVFRMGPSNSVAGDRTDVSIASGDEGHFAVRQQTHGGVISLRRTVTEPRDFLLTVDMRLVRYGTSYSYMAKIAVIVTPEHRFRPTRAAHYYHTYFIVLQINNTSKRLLILCDYFIKANPPTNETLAGFFTLYFAPRLLTMDVDIGEHDGSVRCIKSCRHGDLSCPLDPVHLVTYTVLSLPTFRDFTGPEEIVFLRTATGAGAAPSPGAGAAPSPGAADVVFDIQSADDRSSFDVIKGTYQGMVMGVVRQVKPIAGPKEVVVEVAMNYVKSGVVSHRNIVEIHVFISALWF